MRAREAHDRTQLRQVREQRRARLAHKVRDDGHPPSQLRFGERLKSNPRALVGTSIGSGGGVGGWGRLGLREEGGEAGREGACEGELGISPGGCGE
jgi:hypothetical protein